MYREEAKQATEFKARPAPVRRASFEVRTSDKAPTQPAEFELASSRRASNRLSFDLNKEKQAQQRELEQREQALAQKVADHKV